MSDMNISRIVREPEYIARADEPVRALKHQFEVEAIRSLIVLGDTGPMGVITRREFRSMDDGQLDDPVSNHVMEVPTLTESMNMIEAREIVQRSSFDAERLPVVNENGQLVGEVMREELIQDSPTHTAESSSITLHRDGSVGTIQSGMDVRGSDGKKLGEVAELFVENDLATEISVKHGFLSRKHKRIPGDVVQYIEDDDVHVSIGEMEFNSLADIEDAEV